ncbi:NADP-dependent malic enzyme [Bacteroides helcogenes]|uniref:Allosteric NADP-dependent malic enzyme n=1 Tax=Bacteroides helcogenes (strain ATCC 35417 / DSM 20613 / JCM 6297 / CCUG 15421 / P 36-108) TaxID=693979 RepID=E6SRN2_BACT6|nr:NADP-dependent malic enzyme [Bacteroides helcogenes]ADV45122.1 allosteric NADP-dependent malic enzyme [Bacteroides helcogenes P 36-108]MDY5238680.1 NADP-dependent malic enzyme [Bacteroides helcogenes]
MAKITKEAALLYHSQGKPGKIEVVPTKPYSTQTDLSLAYSPGVAEPCLEIEKNPQDAYKYTAKGNLVAVISNGTAVLGLGDIGALAGKPVMEGKGLLFKIYGGIDVFDIEVNEKDPDKFIEAVKAIAPTFGGINLEDIKAPECFEIERRLKAELDIPVMHDDQHGTAIISSAGLLNALEVAGKKIEDVKIVVNGAGAAAISCTKLYEALGATHENIVMLDSKGVITSDRDGLNETKRYFATDRRDIHTLEEAVCGADVFLGLSKGNVLTQDMIRSMADTPIVFALANPVPEITYEEAMAARPDVLMSTGRSDYPNQINNVIGFPYIFRGALDVAAKAINEEMKLAAVRAIADLAKQPVPDVVNEIYHVNNFTFGSDYFIPKPVDPRLITEVSMAVARAAMESGVARKPITDWEAYRQHLKELMGQESKLTRQLRETARRNPQRVVFAEGIHPNMLKAAVEAKSEGICQPILLGNDEAIEKLAKELEISLEGIEIVNLRHPDEAPRRERYARILAEKRARQGATYEEANDKMFERNYFGMMMVETGEADAFITGLYTKYSNTIKVAKEVIGIRPEYKHFGTMHILNSKRGTYFLTDTLINRHPDTDTLIDVAKLAENTVHFFNHTPVMAMLSYSNFGADTEGSPMKVHEAVEYMQQNYPDLAIDGEMQVNFAMNRKMRDAKYPFTRLKGKDVNTLIFPNLSSANSAYKLLQAMDTETELIGPIQMGLNKPIHFTDFESSVRDIVNITAVAVIDAIVDKKKNCKNG